MIHRSFLKICDEEQAQPSDHSTQAKTNDYTRHERRQSHTLPQRFNNSMKSGTRQESLSLDDTLSKEWAYLTKIQARGNENIFRPYTILPPIKSTEHKNKAPDNEVDQVVSSRNKTFVVKEETKKKSIKHEATLKSKNNKNTITANKSSNNNNNNLKDDNTNNNKNNNNISKDCSMSNNHNGRDNSNHNFKDSNNIINDNIGNRSSNNSGNNLKNGNISNNYQNTSRNISNNFNNDKHTNTDRNFDNIDNNDNIDSENNNNNNIKETYNQSNNKMQSNNLANDMKFNGATNYNEPNLNEDNLVGITFKFHPNEDLPKLPKTPLSPIRRSDYKNFIAEEKLYTDTVLKWVRIKGRREAICKEMSEMFKDLAAIVKHNLLLKHLEEIWMV